ncbi:hypothetical protein V8E36_005964 [Tilletia maclaganii]
MFRLGSTAGAAAVAAAVAASSSASSSSASTLAWRTAARISSGPLSQQEQRRTLTSTVLLTRTRAEYEAKRLNDLKDELRQRGLATSGRRDELVRRLLNDDVKRAGSNNTLPPNVDQQQQRSKTTAASPPKGASKTPATADSATPSSSPSLASLRQQQQSKQGENTAPLKPSKKAAPAETPNPAVANPATVISAGIPVEKGATIAAPGVSSPSIKEAPAPNPPGVPQEVVEERAASASAAKVASSSSDGGAVPAFDIKIPYEVEKPEPPVDIPLVTSYFHPGESIPDAVRSADEDYHSNPKVVAVGGSATTNIAHHATDDANHPSADSTSSPKGVSGALHSLLNDFRKDLGIPQSQVDAAASAASDGARSARDKVEQSSTLEEAIKPVKDVLAFASEGGGAGEAQLGSSSSSSIFSRSSSPGGSPGGKAGSLNRPLSAEERTGAYLLGAIVFGGLLVGGLAAPADPEKKAKKAQSGVKAAVKDVRDADGVVAKAGVVASEVKSAVVGGGGGMGGRGRVNKALEEHRGSASAGVAGQFSSGENIVGAGPRKW